MSLARFHLLVPHEGACECKVEYYARVWSLLVIFTYLIKPKLSVSIVLKTAAANTSIPLGTLRLGLYFLNSLEQFRLWLPHCYTEAKKNYSEHIIYMIHHREGASDLESFQCCVKWKSLIQWHKPPLLLPGRQLFRVESWMAGTVFNWESWCLEENRMVKMGTYSASGFRDSRFLFLLGLKITSIDNMCQERPILIV